MIGFINENVRNVVIKIDNNGVNKLFNIVGIILCNFFLIEVKI